MRHIRALVLLQVGLNEYMDKGKSGNIQKDITSKGIKGHLWGDGSPPLKKETARAAALKISAVYGILGALWILLVT